VLSKSNLLTYLLTYLIVSSNQPVSIYDLETVPYYTDVSGSTVVSYLVGRVIISCCLVLTHSTRVTTA